MVPLVFIILVAAVLIAMVAWILSSTGIRNQTQKPSRKQDFNYNRSKDDK
ncbi:MAG: hypothetical protein PHC92_04860 [Syntrophomonadaceae bacterium]|nr:hypothetical protein [Syntrophomonadaceae bacterium]MDD3023168.1 hypothetical protein [Syntrophomonadaceae bacterium]